MAWVRGEQRNPAEPEEGYYAVKLVKKGPEVGAKIIRREDSGLVVWAVVVNYEDACASEDPELNGALQQVWLFGRKIDFPEYNYLLERCRFFRLRYPDHPYANPQKPIDDTARRLMGPQED